MTFSIRRKLSHLLRSFRRFREDDFHIVIERSWSTDTAIGIKGWAMAKKGIIDKMEVTVDDITVPVTSWHELSQTEKTIPRKNSGVKRGFWIQIPRNAKHRAVFRITQAEKNRTKNITFEGSSPHPPKEYPSGEEIFNNFVKRVNDKHLHVLEIGSRILPPKKNGLRNLFSRAGSYTGFDYYADSNTDITGDAHHLSSYFDGKKFDAVFSIAVFEHLAMPWVVAMEINKILKIGGITCHQIPFAWPAHERPWDFWRCSDEGLKVLFSPSLGFETISAGMYAPLRMYFDTLIPGQEGFPLVPCFGCSSILSMKTKELDQDKFRWDVNLKEVLGERSHYPKPKKMVT